MLLTHRQLQRRKHARVSKWQLYNLRCRKYLSKDR